MFFSFVASILFIYTVQKNKINLILVVSPTQKNIDLQFYEVLNKISLKYKVDVLDYSKDSMFQNT